MTQVLDEEEEAAPSPAPADAKLTPGQRAIEILRPVGVYAASRVVCLAAAGIAVVAARRSFTSLFLPWDSGWYVTTAMTGYPHSVPMVDGHAAASHIAFFPVLPLLTRGLYHLTGLSPLRAGLVVTFVFGALTAVLLWYLARRLFGPEVADRTVALFCFFPGSFVFSLVYAEPVMLALAIGCLIALLDRRWVVAGVLAALATATRPNAVVLVACCAFEAGRAILQRRDWRSLVAPVLAPLGIIVFFVFLRVRTGSWTAWFRVEEGGWGERIQPTALLHYAHIFLRQGFREWNYPVPLFGALLIVILGVLLLRLGSRVPPVLLVYTACIVALTLASKTLGARPRFVLTAFPLFFGLAYYVRRTAFTVLVAVFAGMLSMITILSLSTLALTP